MKCLTWIDFIVFELEREEKFETHVSDLYICNIRESNSKIIMFHIENVFK